MKGPMVGEYDGYTLPEHLHFLKEDTPETKKRRMEIHEEIKAVIARHLRESEEKETAGKKEKETGV